ncbi:MAG: TonB-dependent receptor plug domain-containing protein [Gemmatimonadaceae bacterium]
MDNVDRIEIVRGPASVLYGSDAVTGVVQVFTRRATRPRELDITAGTGSHADSEKDPSAGTAPAHGARAPRSHDPSPMGSSPSTTSMRTR